MRTTIAALILCASVIAIPLRADPPRSIHIDAKILTDIDAAVLPLSRAISNLDVSAWDLKYKDGKQIDTLLPAIRGNIDLALKASQFLKTHDSIYFSYLLTSALSQIQITIALLESMVQIAADAAQAPAAIKAITALVPLETPIGLAQNPLDERLGITFGVVDAALQDCQLIHTPAPSNPPPKP